MSEIGVDSPIPGFIGVGQSGPLDQGTKPSAIEISLVCRQTHLDSAQTFAIRQLGKSHRQKRRPTRKPSNALVAVIASNTDAKIVVRDKLQNLTEDCLLLA